jgi:lysophospholipase L1-like esterase
MVRFLALGDSYTVGEAIDFRDCWPHALADLLRREGRSISDPTIVARTGWTTGELAIGIDEAELEPDYGLVAVLIGVNDQYRGRSPEGYRLSFRDLLCRALTFVNGEPSRVIVLSIPDWGVTPFASGCDRAAISREIDKLNAVNGDEARKRGVPYAEITTISRAALHDESLVAHDGLHPSTEQYKRWVNVVAPIAREILIKNFPNDFGDS